MIKQAILCALGAASLAIPGMSAAQTYHDQGYGQGYSSNSWERHGDYYNGDGYGRYRRFNGYPEFQGLTNHIRSEILEGQREDLIDRDGAQYLLDQLRNVKIDENREYQRHGWRLPDDDRYRIRSEYERLDREVDRIREEPEG